MAYYELAKVREDLTGTTSGTKYDMLIANKGTQADEWVVSQLRKIYEISNRTKELPIFDITNGKVNGSAAPQYIKDLASNRTAYLCLIAIKLFDVVKEYKEMIKDQLETIKADLETNEDTNIPFAIV